MTSRWKALAVDYDGTLADDGAVAPSTLAALERARAAGLALVLVTGREVESLARAFPRLDLLARVVAENGAVLLDPATGAERVLAPPMPAAFVDALRARGIAPLSVGRVIVATREPHERTALEVVRDQRLELELVFNKGAVMVLPTGVNKASGARAALDALGIAPRDVIAAGDGENDHSLLRACGLGVAVANAVPSLRALARLVTKSADGAGIVELLAAWESGALEGAAGGAR